MASQYVHGRRHAACAASLVLCGEGEYCVGEPSVGEPTTEGVLFGVLCAHVRGSSQRCGCCVCMGIAHASCTLPGLVMTP
eukprot:65300-Chlamydomonas_euryale.AAC.2